MLKDLCGILDPDVMSILEWGENRMKIERTTLDGVLAITPNRIEDARGHFTETYSKRAASEALGRIEFVQDNHSVSRKAGTLRGLHFQAPPFAQDKLVRCSRGAIFDVAVDFRQGSLSFGEWFATELSSENGKQLFIPAGFLHGFLTLEPDSEVIYKCSNYYASEADGTVLWSSLGIDWPLENRTPILSEKDQNARPFSTVSSPFKLEACA